jgi:hypothetical protein
MTVSTASIRHQQEQVIHVAERPTTSTCRLTEKLFDVCDDAVEATGLFPAPVGVEVNMPDRFQGGQMPSQHVPAVCVDHVDENGVCRIQMGLGSVFLVVEVWTSRVERCYDDGNDAEFFPFFSM